MPSFHLQTRTTIGSWVGRDAFYKESIALALVRIRYVQFKNHSVTFGLSTLRGLSYWQRTSQIQEVTTRLPDWDEDPPPTSIACVNIPWILDTTPDVVEAVASVARSLPELDLLPNPSPEQWAKSYRDVIYGYMQYQRSQSPLAKRRREARVRREAKKAQEAAAALGDPPSQ